MKSRYCYNPMTARRIGRRVTLFDRIRRRRALPRAEKPDLYPVGNYWQPIYPGK